MSRVMVRLYTRTEGWREVHVFDDMPPVWTVLEHDPPSAASLRSYFDDAVPEPMRCRTVTCVRHTRHVHPLWRPMNLGYGWLDVVYVEPE